MPVVRRTLIEEDGFNHALTLTNGSTEGGTGWTFFENGGANGTTSCATIDSATGRIQLTLANNAAATNASIYQNDVLTYDIDQIDFIEWTAEVAAIGATTVATFGIGSNRASDEDTVVESAWFKIEGATNTSTLVVESDDGTNDNNDVSTSGESLSNSQKRMKIDFTYGTDDVRFYVENSDGDLVRVASGTTFDMSNYTGNLQPIVNLTKGATAGQPQVTIDHFRIQYKTAI